MKTVLARGIATAVFGGIGGKQSSQRKALKCLSQESSRPARYYFSEGTHRSLDARRIIRQQPVNLGMPCNVLSGHLENIAGFANGGAQHGNDRIEPGMDKPIEPVGCNARRLRREHGVEVRVELAEDAGDVALVDDEPIEGLMLFGPVGPPAEVDVSVAVRHRLGGVRTPRDIVQRPVLRLAGLRRPRRLATHGHLQVGPPILARPGQHRKERVDPLLAIE